MSTRQIGNPGWSRIKAAVDSIPVIDCHEHFRRPGLISRSREPIAYLITGYVASDLHSAGASDADIQFLSNSEISTDGKWAIFERLWKKTEHTAYARVVKLVLRDFYGEEELTRDTVERVGEKLGGLDDDFTFRVLEKANIQMVLADALGWEPGDLGEFVDGRYCFPGKWKPLFPLPKFHCDIRSFDAVQQVAALVGRHVVSLDQFAECVFELIHKCKARGLAGIKDQSAYVRPLEYEMVPKSDAERLFNKILSDPRNSLGWPEAKPLDDYLFHQYMGFARELKLPVQLHTGHMAGIRNRVDKTNAKYLARIFELYRDVRFDVFHGNWPYMGDLLFLAKNYPNVYIDCCWLHIIDPLYARELLSRAVMTVPHSKVCGFGGDYAVPEFSAAHLKIARSNIAAALFDLVDGGWITESEATGIAADWLFNNPNELFELGFERFSREGKG